MVSIQFYNSFLAVMAITALIVFIALYFVKAGYGQFVSKKWGVTVPNRLGWVLMEAPVFILMCLIAFCAHNSTGVVVWILFAMFQLHYFQRSFIFPFLLKGKSRMPLSIIAMGIIFNSCNALMQGGWLFYFAPEGFYTTTYLGSPQFIVGTLLFFAGMAINLDSDRRVRNLRKEGDTKHYLPHGGFYEYVTSANYFGEFVEWCGFAIAMWSWSGAVFALWSFANLAPRAASIYKKYSIEFAPQFKEKKLKRIIPFIY